MSTVVIFQAFVELTQAIQFQAGQVHQVAHVSHLSHFGIPKLNTAALLVHELLTVAEHHASSVVVVPTLIVAAAQVAHVSHFKHVLAPTKAKLQPFVSVNSISSPLKAAAHTLAHVDPVLPVSPLSHFKQIFASVSVTILPSSSVKSISFQLNAAFIIAAHVSHLQPCGHCGTTKFNTALWQSPELVTHAQLPGAQVVVDPTHTVAALPVSHFSPFRFEYCAFLILSPSSLSLKSIKSSCAMEFFSS